MVIICNKTKIIIVFFLINISFSLIKFNGKNIFNLFLYLCQPSAKPSFYKITIILVVLLLTVTVIVTKLYYNNFNNNNKELPNLFLTNITKRKII